MLAMGISPPICIQPQIGMRIPQDDKVHFPFVSVAYVAQLHLPALGVLDKVAVFLELTGNQVLKASAGSV